MGKFDREPGSEPRNSHRSTDPAGSGPGHREMTPFAAGAANGVDSPSVFRR